VQKDNATVKQTILCGNLNYQVQTNARFLPRGSHCRKDLAERRVRKGVFEIIEESFECLVYAVR